VRYILSMLLICAAVGTAVVLYLTKPKARKARPPRPLPLVEAVPLHATSEPVVVEAFGTVVAAKQLTLQAQVAGQIVYQEPNLVPGGLIPAGRELLRIDPNDYRLAVLQHEAEVEEAQFEAEVERGRGVIARREWTLLEKEVATSDAGKRLALRQPHQERAAARLKAAQSRLAQARLDRDRTTLRCPFNALVLAESVEEKQLVREQTALATLVGTDEFWVEALVPLARLPRIRVPTDGRSGSAAKVILETGNGEAIVRTGRVLRLLGDLTPSGRMARVLVAMDDPLDLPDAPESGGSGPVPRRMGPRRVLLGSYVKVEIDAGREENAYVVPRSALREGDRLWLVGEDRTLRFRDVDVLWRRRSEVLVRGAFRPDEKLVVSRLSAPLPGTEVRLGQAATAPASTQPAAAPAEGGR